MEIKPKCCAIIGQPLMRFPWGFDEEDSGCQELKLALAQRIMELRQRGVTRFAVVAAWAWSGWIDPWNRCIKNAFSTAAVCDILSFGGIMKGL